MNNKSLKLNMLLNGILRASSLLFPLVTFPYVSRVLGATGMGKITFSNSVVTYFLMFAQLGIPTYGIRACAKVKNDKTKLSKVVYELLNVEIIMSLITILCLVGSVFVVPKFLENKTLIFIFSTSIFLNVCGMEWLYQALEEYVYITWRSLVFKFLSMILMFIFIRDKDDFVLYGGLMVLASSGSYVCNMINLRKHIYYRKEVNEKLNSIQHIKPSLVFFAMTVATTIYTNLDNLMLGFMSGDGDVGFYTAAVKVKTFLVSTITSIGIVVLPRATRAIENKEKGEFGRLMNMSLHLVVFLCVPLVSVFIIFAKPTIFILSGLEYLPSVVPMQIILPSVLFIGITNILGYQVLVPLNGEKYMLLTVISGAVIDLIINSILIGKFHSSGAALGTLLAEFVVLVVQYCYIRFKYKIRIELEKFYKVYLTGIGCFVVLYLFSSINMNMYVLMILGTIIYGSLYVVILIIWEDDMALYIKDMVLTKFVVRKR